MDEARWTALEALAEPRRRAVLAYVTAQDRAVTRDDVAAALGVARALAAHHLDRLVASGLLVATFGRPPGVGGPGAGRPAKRYSPARAETTVSLPPRRYDLAARIFARALADRVDPVVVAGREGHTEGRGAAPGRRLGVDATLGQATRLLDGLGYAPQRGAHCVRLRNCPFEGILEVAPELMCTVNHAFLSGLLAGLRGSPRVTAVLDADMRPDCCVRLETVSPRPPRPSPR